MTEATVDVPKVLASGDAGALRRLPSCRSGQGAQLWPQGEVHPPLRWTLLKVPGVSLCLQSASVSPSPTDRPLPRCGRVCICVCACVRVHVCSSTMLSARRQAAHAHGRHPQVCLVSSMKVQVDFPSMSQLSLCLACVPVPAVPKPVVKRLPPASRRGRGGRRVSV